MCDYQFKKDQKFLIDIVKNHFRDEFTLDDAKLLQKLKILLDIK